MDTDLVRVVIATRNPGKLAEWQAMLAGTRFEPVPWDGLSPDEDADTYEGNALLKATAACRETRTTALGDDVGIAIEALHGGPGLNTRRWAEEHGGFAAARRDVARTALDSPAIYRCGLAWVEPGGRVLTALGEVHGRIVDPVVAGAGFEPCFAPDGATRALASLTGEERAVHHHRERAWRALLAQLTA